MKKFFSLVLALVMALSLTTVAWGATTVTTEQQLNDALAAGGEITLNSNIALANGVTVAAGVEVTLNLNGKTLSYTTGHAGSTALIANNGTLTINGPGTITNVATNPDSDWEPEGFPTYANNTITNCGILVVNGATIENGTSGSGAYYAIDNNSGNRDAIATINDGVITCTNNVAIRQFANSTTNKNEVNIVDGEVTGTRAVWIQLPSGDTALEQKAELNVEGGTLTATGSNNMAVYCYSYGASYTETEINISGGTFNGDVALGGYADYNKITGTETLTITGGDFNGEIYTYNDKVDEQIEISGGTFSGDVSAYVVDGKQLLANGTVVTTPAASATDPVLYKWDNAGAEWDAYFIATGDDLDDLKMDASDNCLPCYKINGEYFVEVKEAVATFKLVYGAKTVFLTPVAAEDVCYSAKASVLKVVDDEDATCGDWYVADLDEDDVYYISYDKKGVVVEGVYVAAKNGPVQILVKGKIVNVKSLTQADIKQLPHDWKGYDVVNHEYTTVKCANCGKVATLYANGTAAGKNAVKVSDNGTVLGYITAAADSFGAASAGTSTDKTVTSADTFDAGIAMYVGMSVMAAAGSAVVIGKKKD